MGLERTWLLGVARAERDALGRTIQYTPPGAWEGESPLAGWRNRDIIAHLAASDVAAAAVLAGESPAEIEEFAKGREGGAWGVDEFNDWTVQRRASESFRAVVREWGQAADRFLARAAGITTEEWATRKVPWTVGEIGVRYLVQSRLMEWYLHGEDILLAGGNPPRLIHEPIFCVNDLAVRTIPYALSVAGLSFPGRSVKVELDGVGEGTWHWGLAPRESPAPGVNPDCSIQGQGRAFCLVAARRVPADYFLSEGILRTSGDDELAETILRHLRAFAE